MSSTIHVIGSMMIDRVMRVRSLPRAGETVPALSSATFAGGKGANQAAAAAKCGARVRMLGRTGRDGGFIVEALAAAGVDVGAVSTADRVSGVASVLVAESGENAIVIAAESNTRVVLPEIEDFLKAAVPGDIVAFQNECSCLHEGIAHAAARALRVWLNAAPADASLASLRFEKLSGLVVNETEAEALTGEREPRRALELLAARMPGGTVIVTLGAEGAIVAVGKSRYAHRGFQVAAVDTVGCGDAFVGAYLAALSQGRDPAQALARANAAGALAAMRAGAMPALPNCREVDVASALPEGTRLKPRPQAEVDAAASPTLCAGCGYDLKGKAVGERCPECGRAITLVVTRSGRLRREDLERMARGARWIIAGAGLLAAYAGVAILAGIAGQGAATLVMGTLLGTQFMTVLLSRPLPLAILAADVALVSILRDMCEATGAAAGARWRSAARKARIGMLLVLPVVLLLGGGVGTAIGYLLWGACVASAAKELLDAARAALRRAG